MTVAGITGHRDLHDPDAVKARIEEAVDALRRPLVGVSTLAAGADQLFADAVLAHGGRLEVIVPSADYAETLDPDARSGFERLAASAASLDVLPSRRASPTAYVAAAEAMLDRCDVLLAVWDGEEGRGAGGTADVIRRARERAIPVWILPSERPMADEDERAHPA